MKKNRDKERLFLVEGRKMVEEALASNFDVHSVYSTEPMQIEADFHLSSSQDLERISTQKTPHQSIAVVKYKNWDIPDKGLFVGLDDVRDPGNLGTIIRSANWFGADGIICSENSVDCYNPKVVRASMGGIFRLPVLYVDLANYLKEFSGESFVLDLEGDSIYDAEISKENCIYVMGNEANGISQEISDNCANKIKIPGGNGQESLNVSMATTVVLSEVYRQS